MTHLYGLGIAVASLLLMSQPAQAAFEPTDWKAVGDSSATLHKETGLEWMDLSLTKSMSINQVISQLGEGGAFQGWRLPTMAEMFTLISSISSGVSFDEDGLNTSKAITGYGENSLSQSFRENLGDTITLTTLKMTYGIYLNPEAAVNGLPYVMMGGASRQPGIAKSTYFYNAIAWSGNYTQNAMDLMSSSYGVYLVSDGGDTLSSINNPLLNVNNPNAPVNDVAVPAMAGVGGLICLMMAGFRRFRAS